MNKQKYNQRIKRTSKNKVSGYFMELILEWRRQKLNKKPQQHGKAAVYTLTRGGWAARARTRPGRSRRASPQRQRLSCHELEGRAAGRGPGTHKGPEQKLTGEQTVWREVWWEVWRERAAPGLLGTKKGFKLGWGGLYMSICDMDRYLAITWKNDLKSSQVWTGGVVRG